MTVEISKVLKKYWVNCENIKLLLKETAGALNEINDHLPISKEVKVLLTAEARTNLMLKIKRSVIIVVYGDSDYSKACFVNLLLGYPVLPYKGENWRPVHFKYGPRKSIRLIYNNEYEVMEQLKAHTCDWTTIPEVDLQRTPDEITSNSGAALEVELSHPFFKDNLKMSVAPNGTLEIIEGIFSINTRDVIPIIVYPVWGEKLTEPQLQQVCDLKILYKSPILFVSFNQIEFNCRDIFINTSADKLTIVRLQGQLMRKGILRDRGNRRTDELGRKNNYCYDCSNHNKLTYKERLLIDLCDFIDDTLKCNLLHVATKLNRIHDRCLKKFILYAFDMAREIQITPKRIAYAQEIELKLYKTLIEISREQQEQLCEIITRILEEMKLNINSVLECNNGRPTLVQWTGIVSNSALRDQTSRRATIALQEVVLDRVRITVANELVQSVGCLHESFTGTLQRCLEKLEKNCHDFEGHLSASDAVKQILTAAYSIDLKSSTSFSGISSFLDRLKKVLLNFLPPWPFQAPSDSSEHIRILNEILDHLSVAKLAKTISKQFQLHVENAHEGFKNAIRSLENQLSGQLEQTEEQRISIRKRHAPRFARLALESTSICDVLVWGMPNPIKEIGRGQYGVVFSSEPWGEINPCAFKSIVPPDDRHWSDLSMEFYYTRTLPEHPRIVKLHGSVIDYTYGGGNSPAVLLIMERMIKDLFTGIRDGLSWATRLRISVDVVEGIRYLHSQGLVHRDIKLKNVLLDENNRAKLTDFGFCTPEAMMSGSIVGTPVHMAPELLSGHYDSSVDVYAFGILFWYICSGQVKLPNNFDNHLNKEHLWNSVKRGVRPECLEHFHKDCWELMKRCWAGEPSERPLLGDVQPQLETLYRQALEDEQKVARKEDLEEQEKEEPEDSDYETV